MRPRERRSLGVLALTCLSSCLYDADDRCGENQEHSNGICVCVDGYVQKGSVCEEVQAPADGSSAPTGGAMPADGGGRLPYTGQKNPCTDHASCAAFDAKYCNMLTRTCLVRDCTETSCDPGYMCFDVSMFVPGEPKVCVDPADFPQ